MIALWWIWACARPTPASPPDPQADPYARARAALVAEISGGDIDKTVLAAIATVPRHRFMPRNSWPAAYLDRPLSIGHDQTISQPTVVGMMSTLAAVDPGDKVLEVGTGSGYQAAVLAELGAVVYSIEILEPLAIDARKALDSTGYGRVHTRTGDGYTGWPEAAPFHAVVVTAAPPVVPQPLIDQLAEGGVLVIPVGPKDAVQELVTLTRSPTGIVRKRHAPVRFVPMTGEAQERGE